MLIKKVSDNLADSLDPGSRDSANTLPSRPSPSASTSSATARTRTPSSASFSSSPVSTVSLATTAPSVSCPRTGSTSPPPPAPWSLKQLKSTCDDACRCRNWEENDDSLVKELGIHDGKTAFRGMILMHRSGWTVVA